MTTSVSVPGKLLLLGDHAVVYGRPALVAAINQYLYVDVEPLNEPVVRIDAPAVGLVNYEKSISEVGRGDIPKGAAYVEAALAVVHPEHGVHVTTRSEIDPRFGFGSSAATTVGVIAAMQSGEIDGRAVFDSAYDCLQQSVGVGSGVDMAAATFGGIVDYIRDERIEPVTYSPPFTLLVGYSGTSSHTPTVVNEVAEKRAADVEAINQLFNRSSLLVEIGRRAIERNDLAAFGVALDAHHEVLQELGVSTDALDELCELARKNGAYGAKLSGAGGGDCMIAVAPTENEASILDAFTSAGYEATSVQVSQQGVTNE